MSNPSSQTPPVVVFDIRRYLSGGWYLPGAFIVKQDPDGKLSHIVQNASPITIGGHGIQETPLLAQLFSIVEMLSEKALEDKFNAPKGKPKPLPELLQNPDVKKLAERFVHRNMDIFFKKMVENKLPLTFMAEKKVLLEDVRVRYPEDELVPHLIFRKTKTDIKYRLNFTTGGERWLVKWKQPVPLTNHPGWLLVGDFLYQLPDLNGYLVRPFLEKDEIAVPNRMVKTYFEKFILKTVEKAEIEADGFDMTSTRKLEGCELSIAKHLFHNQWFIAVRFYYLGASFQQNDPREMRTALHFHPNADGSHDVRIMQVKRSPEGEKSYLDLLVEKGFQATDGNLWQVPDGVGEGKEGEGSLFAVVGWLSAHATDLEAGGFSLEMPVFEDKKISLLPASYAQKSVAGHDWFDLQIIIKVGGFEFPFSKLAGHIRDKNPYFLLPDETYFIIPEEWMARFQGLAHFGKLEGDHLRINKAQRPLLESLGLAEPEADVPKPEYQFELSPLLKATLRPYQFEGAKWLAGHYHENLGACLADDMGLGKTLQTLAILLFAKQKINDLEQPPFKGGRGDDAPLKKQFDLFGTTEPQTLRALIILPASLVFNWESEVKKFAPGLLVGRHTGPQRTKDPRILQRYDLVLTTYQTAARDLDILKKTAWEYVVLDESQYIKNPDAQIFKAVGELVAKHKISLSGTPIENSLGDLWAQMQFLNPGMLGTFPYFKKYFQQPIEKKGDEQKKEQLKLLVAPYLLRRTKEEVAPDLPDLTEQVFYVEMTEGQRKLYEKEKSAARNQLLNIGDPAAPVNRFAVLAALMKLRQIANHPGLISDLGFGISEGDGANSEIQNPHSGIESGKFEDVTAHWETIRRSGHKALIFSSFEKHLQLYKAYFEKEKLPFAWLTGDVAAANRKKEVARFQEDAKVQAFFMTLKAGGVGLNLTAADYVLLLDPWWNPASENQAIARAHRIGQTKKVMALRFITKDTIEEKILKMQERKKELAGGILETGEKEVWRKEELEDLLG